MRPKRNARKEEIQGRKAVNYLARIMVQSTLGKKISTSRQKLLALQAEASKALLDMLSTGQIARRIARFRALPFQEMGYGEVYSAVEEVLSQKIAEHAQITVLRQHVGDIRTGSLLYRARKNAHLRHVDDCWSPPPDKATSSRLNREGEPVLYASCEDHRVVLDEVEAEPNDAVSVIVYRAKVPIKLASVGIYPNLTDLTPEQVEKQRLFTDFLREEFTRRVDRGSEYMYQIPQAIAKHLYTGPAQDGWLYPSVRAGRSLYNVCLLPKRARRKLELVGVVAMTVLTRTDSELETFNHFFGTVREDGESLQYGRFTMEAHERYLPGQVRATTKEARQQVERLTSVPGSWPHLFRKEMAKRRQ